VFAINAASFLISASLIAGIRLPRIEAPAGPRPSAFRDVVEGARYSLSTPLVRGLLLVIGIVLVAAASKAPLESLFVMGTLSLGPEALGLVMGSWGIGMLIGSAAAPAICRQWPRERVLVVMIVVVAGCVLVAARAGDIETVLLAWLVAGAANSIANVAYESLLQERTPNEFRGRVFAAFGFVRNVAFLAGAFMAGWLGSHLGIRLSYVFSGGLFLVAAAVCKITLGERVRRGTLSRVVHFLAPRTRARASSYAGAVNGSADSDRQRVFALAQELGSVRAACRAVGIHPSTYYRWKTKFEHDRGRPGAVVEMDIFPVRRLPGKGGEVWQYTAIDLATGYCWAELHITRRDPSARLTSDLAERVAADLASRGWVLQRVLTGDGAEFRSDRFEQTVARLGADHEFMRGATAQDNGVVERLQRTIRDECWGPTLARFVPADYAGLRSVLEKYVAGHNARSSLAGHPPARPQESRPTSLMPALRRP
jgi:transposase InsO family protein